MAKAQRETVETVETIDNLRIERFFKSGAWSYELLDADGNEVGSVWLVNKIADLWARKGGGRPFNAPVKGEDAAVAWLHALAVSVA